MSPRPGVPSLGALLLLGVLIAVWLGGGCEQDEPDRGGENAPSRAVVRVLRVVDGDTIEVRIGGEVEDVRYIGVDTPESVAPGEPVECFGDEASDFNARLVEDELVRLDFGVERRDDYGRLLAYVYLLDKGGDETFVNAELVRLGYATTLTIEPNDRFATLFARLERRAGVSGRGLWGDC